jgi:hypothetical protein
MNIFTGTSVNNHLILDYELILCHILQLLFHEIIRKTQSAIFSCDPDGLRTQYFIISNSIVN